MWPLGAMSTDVPDADARRRRRSTARASSPNGARAGRNGRVAEAFVPPRSAPLRAGLVRAAQELTDAAWGGSDPRPGEAKLAWWAEELHGWAQRRAPASAGHGTAAAGRRHGRCWPRRLPSLRASRERPPRSPTRPSPRWQPLATAVARIDAEPVRRRDAGPWRRCGHGVAAGSARFRRPAMACAAVGAGRRRRWPAMAVPVRPGPGSCSDRPLPAGGTRVRAALGGADAARVAGAVDGAGRCRRWRAALARAVAGLARGSR